VGDLDGDRAAGKKVTLVGLTGGLPAGLAGSTNVEEALRTQRSAMARKKEVPAYVILKDTEPMRAIDIFVPFTPPALEDGSPVTFTYSQVARAGVTQVSGGAWARPMTCGTPLRQSSIDRQG